MSRMVRCRSTLGWFAGSALLLGLVLNGSFAATLIRPSHPDEVLQKLGPRTRAVSVAATEQELSEAVADHLRSYRQSHDMRHLGRAEVVLSRWAQRQDGRQSAQWLLLQATVDQALHRFELALERLTQVTRLQPANAQAWLTLANLHRVAGRYAQARRSCAQVGAAGEAFYGQACDAELASLLGDPKASVVLAELVGRSADRASRAWLTGLLAEAQERIGLSEDARKAYRASLALELDPYVLVAYADFLLSQGQAAAVLPLLTQAPATDAVALRRLRAARAKDGGRPSPEWKKEVAALSATLAANAGIHGREAAYLKLWLDDQPAAALELAQANLKVQQEPIDWQLALLAAQRAGNSEALQSLQARLQGTGLRDARLAGTSR